MKQMLKQMFVEASEGRYLEPSFHANWSGAHVHLGDNVYANFNDCGIDPSLLKKIGIKKRDGVSPLHRAFHDAFTSNGTLFT